MQTGLVSNHAFYRKIRYGAVPAGVLWCFCFFCSSPPFTFTLNQEYIREQFTGRDFSGRSIGILPLLTARGLLDEKRLSSSAVVRSIRKERPDLHVVEADEVHRRLRAGLVPEQLERFYGMLYKGETARSQRQDSLWRGVGCDFLLVLRLRSGMDIHSFGAVKRQKIHFDAELWDCSAMETVWRVLVSGTSDGGVLSDEQLIIEAFRKVVAALPPSLPAYDTRSW